MICFQFLSLTYWYSLKSNKLILPFPLWFAFNFYLWLIDIHCCHFIKLSLLSCDLLSISIFDLLIFTLHLSSFDVHVVVICFQFLSLTYWYSLLLCNFLVLLLLWFAFNFYLWLIDIHYISTTAQPFACCDLLSISIFDLLIFTRALRRPTRYRVVICFQFLSLTYWYSL